MNHVYFVPPRFKGPQGQEDMPYLLTAGPVTTSRAAKIAMLADHGPDDGEFRGLIADIRRDLKRLSGAGPAHEILLVPGPGLLAVEAVLTSLAPAKRKKTLVISNGRDADAAAAILVKMERPVVKLDKAENATPTVEEVAALLDADHDISHVWMSHCDSTSGLVNPVGDIGKLVKERHKTFLVDASLSFGAMPLDVIGDQLDVMVAVPETCLESVPGFSIVAVRRDLLVAASGKCPSQVMDLHALWEAQEGAGHFRMTPPTQAFAAFRQALRELETEGGIGMRRARYQRNAEELITRMRAMGFTPLLAEGDAGPLVQCFLAPRDKKFDFALFQEGLRQRGYLIAPGLLGKRASFRVGGMGQVDHKVIKGFAGAVEAVLKDLDVQEFTPQNA